MITGDTSAPVSASATVAESSSAESSLQVRGGQAAVLRRLTGRDVHGAAAFAVDVLGDVGQQGEVGEGADDGDGLMDVDAVEHAGQLGAVDLGASHPERLDPGPLDEVEDLLAVLLAHGVAEDGAEQPDVFAHRLGGLAPHLGAVHRADRFQSADARPSAKYRRRHAVPHREPLRKTFGLTVANSHDNAKYCVVSATPCRDWGCVMAGSTLPAACSALRREGMLTA